MPNKLFYFFCFLSLFTSCGISGQKKMEKKCSEKILEKHTSINGSPFIVSVEDTDGLKLDMGIHSETTKTIVTASFSTNTTENQECTCLFDNENQFLSLLEDAYEQNDFENEIPQKFDPKSVKDARSNIPAEVNVKGFVVTAYTWTDLNGVNLLINSLQDDTIKST